MATHPSSSTPAPQGRLAPHAVQMWAKHGRDPAAIRKLATGHVVMLAISGMQALAATEGGFDEVGRGDMICLTAAATDTLRRRGHQALVDDLANEHLTGNGGRLTQRGGGDVAGGGHDHGQEGGGR